MSIDSLVKLLDPIFAWPLLGRLTLCAGVGLVVFIGGEEWLRAAYFKPKLVSTLVPTAAANPVRSEATAKQQEASPPSPGPKKVETKPTERKSERVYIPTSEVGSVTSINQSGGITAGTIGSVNQGDVDAPN